MKGDAAMFAEVFAELVNYHNNDKGIDLPAEPDEKRFSYRAICANLAWCLVDKDRFDEYYKKSEFWKGRLMMVLKRLGMKPFPWEESQRDIEVRQLIQQIHGRKFICSCLPYNSNIDIATVYHLLDVLVYGNVLQPPYGHIDIQFAAILYDLKDCQCILEARENFHSD
jgi:hypothetical protein